MRKRLRKKYLRKVVEKCFVTEIIKLRKCSGWHFVKGAEEHFLSSHIRCQRERRQMTARGLVSVKYDGAE